MVGVQRSTGIVVLDPTNEAGHETGSLATRLDTLDGKVIGFLDNSKPNSDHFLAMLEEELSGRFQLAGVVRARKPTASRICPEEILTDLLSRCDALITAIGD